MNNGYKLYLPRSDDGTIDRPRPRIVISKCMGSERCRYNVEIINSELIKRLGPYADLVPVCMEVETGLGVPRDPLRAVQIEGREEVDPAIDRDGRHREDEVLHWRLILRNGRDRRFHLEGQVALLRHEGHVKVYPPGVKVAVLIAKGSGFFSREVVERSGRLEIEDVLKEYDGNFRSSLARPPRYGSGENVMHAFGYFSEELNPKERSLFIDSLERYTDAKLPFTIPLGMLQSLIDRLDRSYLRQQRSLQPLPDEPIELMSNDASVGRDLLNKLRQVSVRFTFRQPG
ncbi:MAG: DUF523 and DUF1722 domain-containing protein [Euryarchaeota archaeon]|nr:DUF523 and DUF1722 domain-containing protein [Euryarchaeota archaeon]